MVAGIVIVSWEGEVGGMMVPSKNPKHQEWIVGCVDVDGLGFNHQLWMRHHPQNSWRVLHCHSLCVHFTRTQLKLSQGSNSTKIIWSCNSHIADHFYHRIDGSHFFLAFSWTPPPLLPLVQDPRSTTPLFVIGTMNKHSQTTPSKIPICVKLKNRTSFFCGDALHIIFNN